MKCQACEHGEPLLFGVGYPRGWKPGDPVPRFRDHLPCAACGSHEQMHRSGGSSEFWIKRIAEKESEA